MCRDAYLRKVLALIGVPHEKQPMKKRIKRGVYLLMAMLVSTTVAMGQNVGIKTNIVDDALLDVNLGVEVGLAPKWTLDIPGSYNAWILDDGARWKHWWAQPGFRFWFCDRFSGHFLGVHTLGGQYNIGSVDGRIELLGTDFSRLKDTRFQGWFVGGGISYGYTWVLGTHWNLEAEIGVGYAYSRYDEFLCTGCGKKVAEDVPHHYLGPTKAAINLVYLF